MSVLCDSLMPSMACDLLAAVQAGRSLASEALRNLQDVPNSAASRLGFLHNPREQAGESGSTSSIQRAWEAALKLGSRRVKIAGYLQQLLQQPGISHVLSSQ